MDVTGYRTLWRRPGKGFGRGRARLDALPLLDRVLPDEAVPRRSDRPARARSVQWTHSPFSDLAWGGTGIRWANAGPNEYRQQPSYPIQPMFTLNAAAI